MGISELKVLQDQLKTGFYNRLINGEIKKAKDSLKFIFAAFIELNKIIPEVMQNLEEKSANKLNIVWQTFKTSFYEFQALAEKELDLTEQIFKEDPIVWKELLSSIFKKKIDELSSLLETISDLSKLQTKPKEKIPPFEYSPKYAKQKQKNNLYSQYKKVINMIESKIQRYISKSMKTKGRLVEIKGISDAIQTGDWAGHYHADLPFPLNDHRIVYSWDGKIIIFERIGTHKQLGID